MRIEAVEDKQLLLNKSQGEVKLEEVNEFMYFGAVITNKCPEENETEASLIKGNKWMRTINHPRRCKHLSKNQN